MLDQELIIQNLKVKRGEDIIIQNASLILKRGEVVKIRGANGSGKSTLMSSIFSVHSTEIMEGEISVDGVNLKGMPGHDIAKLGVYYAVQHPPVVKGVKTLQFLYKAFKNFHPESEKNIIDWHVDLQKKCRSYNLDINLINDELNSNLSGGEKKLAELIHALALDPKYLLLDECDSGVDVNNRSLVYDFINKQKGEGKGILFTSHLDVGSQVRVDREYVLDNKVLKIK